MPASGPSGGTQGAGHDRDLGAGEAQRRMLSEADLEEIVRAEAAERQAAARDYDRTGHADQAERLRRGAQVLISDLDPQEPGG